MSDDPRLVSEIFGLVRGDLDRAVFELRSPAQVMGTARLWRLERIARRLSDEATGWVDLDGATQALVSGLYGAGRPWIFALRGHANGLELWLGSDSVDMAAAGAAAFGDVRMTRQSFDPSAAARFDSALVLTGSPARRQPSALPRSGLDGLCRSLVGRDWLYAVRSEPVAPAEVSARVNGVAQRIAEVRATHLLRESATDHDNRVAERLVDLLEAKLARLEEARMSGLWNARCGFWAGDPLTLTLARQALMAAFLETTAAPDPVRVSPCEAAASDPAIEALATTELAVLVRPPREAHPGYEIIEAARFGVEPPRVGSAPAVELGRIMDRGRDTGNALACARADLTRHGLIVGATGAGKTNTCFNLLDQVWAAGTGAPFLVIEAAKSEYRALTQDPRFAGLNVYTVGDETLRPLRLNPFEIPSGILAQTHIDFVKALFAASFVLYPPMPYVLEQSLLEIYEDRGWDLARNLNLRGDHSSRRFPTLDDLAAKIGVVVERMGYEQRITMDVRAGLLARVNQLRYGGKGRMLNTRRSVGAAALFETPCVLELKQIVSDDEKAFVIGLVLIRLLEHCEAAGASEDLRHLTLIEEAHRLLRNVNTAEGSEISANPRGAAIETFANILSEIRAYGEGVIVSEQIPSKLAPDVIKNTALKITHRLTAPDDRALIGAALNLDEAQIRRLASLATGEAVAWTERTRSAVLLQAPLSRPKLLAVTSDSGPHDQLGALPPSSPALSACEACPMRRDGGYSPPAQPDPALVAASRRLYNLTCRGAAFADAAAEFAALAARDPSAGSAYCAFVHLAETELERRGEFRRWPHALVDDTLQALAASVGPALGGPTAEASSAPIPRPEAMQAAPFPGCASCNDPCQYRFDMMRADPALGRDFRSAFVDPSAPTAHLAEIARRAAAAAYWPGDRTAVQGAALCFSIQQLATSQLGLSLRLQGRSAELMREQLSTDEAGSR